MSESPLVFTICHHGFHNAAAPEGTAQALDVRAGDGPEEDAFRGHGDRRLCAFLDLELLAKFRRDHDLALGRELNCF